MLIAQLALAEANEKRQHELFLAHGAAQKDWQQSQVDLANAQGGFDTAQIALTAVRKNNDENQREHGQNCKNQNQKHR